MSKAEDILDLVIREVQPLSKREKTVAALLVLEHAGIPLRSIRKLADSLWEEVYDIDDCEQPGESYEECCARVEREEKVLRDQLYLNIDLEG